jgi:hypothetical protein
MMNSWWWSWMVFMFFLPITPVGYGWGYRGWGPPYPSDVQRRRALRAGSGGAAAFDHYSWGWGGDFVGLMLLIGVVWVCAAFWWPVGRP